MDTTFKKKDIVEDQTTRTGEGIEVTDIDSTVDAPDETIKFVKAAGNSVIQPPANATLVKPTRATGIGTTGSAPGTAALKIGSYSGELDKSLIGDASGAQDVKEAYNPDGRFRKKVDQPIKDVNDIVSEQIEVEFKRAPSLSEDRDALEGYRGSIISNKSSLQKASGSQVAEKSMVRSVDEVKRDELYYTDGQNITIEGSDYVEAPTTFQFVDETTMKPKSLPSSKFIDGTSRPSGMKRGNYVPTHLNVVIENKSGKIFVKDMNYTVEDHSIVLDFDEQETLNNSAAHARIHSNTAEVVRQTMEDKAGNEALPNWNALPRAIANATANVGLLKDLETETGNSVLMAHKSLGDSLSYQINRTYKDGLHIQSPIIEAVLGNLIQDTSSEGFEDQNIEDAIFSYDAMKSGAASLIIKMFDTTAKYDSKGTFLNLKRKSFANALVQGELNGSKFRASQNFVDTLRTFPTFSTINKGYDALSPVFMTDNVRLSYNYNFNDFINIKDMTKRIDPEDFDFGLGYIYTAPSNTYATRLNHPLIGGVYNWISEYAANIWRALQDRSEWNKNGTVTLSVPTVFSTTKISLWSIIILHATQQIARQRLSTMRELIDYENNHDYPFDNVVELKTLWGMSSNNYVFSSIDEPLKTKQMDQMVAQTWVLPEQFIPYDEISDSKFRYISPFYFNERNIRFATNGSFRQDNTNLNYSHPIIRPGVTTAELENMVNMHPSQVRLAYDMMTRLPIKQGEANTGRVYKYDVTTDGIFAFDDTKGLTYKDILVQPRQLGLVAVLPYGYATPINETLSTSVEYNKLTTSFVGGTSYRIKIFFTTGAKVTGFGVPTIDYATNKPMSALHTMSSGLRQSWLVSHAGKVGEGNILNGIHLTMSSGFVTTGLTGEGKIELVPGVSLVNPFVKGYRTGSTDFTDSKHGELINLSNHINLRLNQLNFIVSPWDSRPAPARAGEEGIETDPYGFAHMFNFVGFYAMDYNEASDVRLGLIQDLGPNFLSDPWVNSRFNK